MKVRSLFTKSLKTLLSISMALTLITPVLVASADEPGVSNEERTTYTKPETNRETVNFNRDWKFYLGDVEQGQGNDFDDSAWTDIALPHTFDLPYNMSSSFYVGYGWYRKCFEVKEEDINKTISLDFEGSFQITELYVNEKLVGTHEGGYTGFSFDISDYLQAGENNIAVRVNNIWQPDVSPRAGDHQFTGGIYRDVTLTMADPVHVAWYGTFVTTPDLLNPAFDPSAENVLDHYTDEVIIKENIENKRSNVRVETEVINDSEQSQRVKVKQDVVDREGNLKATFESEEMEVAPNTVYNFDTTSEQIQDIELWDTDNPYVYTVYTTVYRDGSAVDLFESPLGFRCAQFKNDGFYLNGEKVLLDGANVHQDHGGWGNAVTNEGFYRDVQMIKDCGMNFIRGSHYPHDPAFADATDEIGILFWSESVFWGMGGCAGQDAPATMTSADWFKDAYPQNPADEEAFIESCKQALTEMIRVNRNHPSIINWSMGNEVFFTGSKTQSKAKALVNELRNLSHQLDPTRKAGMGGVQREGYDSLEICDIAGYNGDGGKFTNLTMPNVVAEYGSKTADRPGEYRPFYDQIQGSTINDYQLKQNSAGLVLWCAFHHGTIGGDGLAKMGMIDYYRLPLNTWYWYREKNVGIKPETSSEGIATNMQITSSETTLKNDGTSDTQLVVTMVDDEGTWVNHSPSVTLTVVEGPGVFPTGKTYTFTPNNTIRDGKAAIEFRSYYSGTTIIEASAPGIAKKQIRLTTTDMTNGHEGDEPDNFMVTEKEDVTDKIADPVAYGNNNVALQRPAFPSSNIEDAGLASDQNVDTQWVADVAGSGQYWMLDSEFEQYFYKAKLDFKETPYSYKIEVSNDKDSDHWTMLASYHKTAGSIRPYEESLHGVKGRYLKVTFTDVPEDAYAHLADIAVYGNTTSQSPAYVSDRVYLSDLTPDKEITQGWVGKQPGIDESIEGNPLRIAGTEYDKGLGLHANSEAVYTLNGNYSRFQSIIGIDDETNGNGDAIFRIYATIEGQREQLIYEQQVTGGLAIPVDVSVSRVQTLRLVSDSNGTNGSDHTNWADAKLFGAVRDMSIDTNQYNVMMETSSEELRAGEKFEVSMQLKNINHSSNTYTAALALYDNNGTLCDISMQNGYLRKGKQTSLHLAFAIPENFINGEARIMVFDTNTLQPYTQVIHVASKAESLIQENDATPRVAEATDLGWLRVDGEDSLIKKEGNWAVWNAGADSGAYMGTETCVEQDNWEKSTLTFTFQGNRVRLGAKYDQSQVGAKIYIDDKLVDTIHTKTDTNVNVYKQAWESDDLGEGSHTITIEPIGKFGLDYLEYSNTWKTIDGEDVTLEKVGNWAVWNAGVDSGAYMNTETYVEAGNWQNSSITYQFTGNQVRIGAKFDQSQVGADVYIDDERVATIRTKTTTNLNEYKQAWESTLLTYGTHTLKIVPIGKFGLDYISYSVNDEDPVVDKSALQELIVQAQTYEKKNYTVASWNAFETALKAAITVNNDVSATNEQVIQATTRLQEMIANLAVITPVGDMSNLLHAFQETLNLIEQEDLTTYEEEGINVLADAFYSGYILYTQQRVEQDQLDQAASHILSAIDELVRFNNINLPRQLLKAAIDKAQILINSGVLEHVNKKVMKNFEVALDVAMKRYANETATDNDLMQAWQSLANAMHYLDFTANTTHLSGLIKECKDMDLSIYEDDVMMDEYKLALVNAEEVITDENSLDASLTAAFNRLSDAKANLVVIKDVIDTTVLDYMIHKADEAIANADKYNTTVASWNVFMDALTAAKTVRADNVSQDAVNAAANQLANAYLDIRLIANEELLKELNDFIAFIDSVNAEAYTSETYMYVMNAKARVIMMVEKVNNQTLTMKEYEEGQVLMADVMTRIEHDKLIGDPGQPSNPGDNNNTPSTPTETPSEEVKAPTVNKGTTKPNTGDATQSGILLGTLLGGCILSAVTYRKRRQKK